jgi:pilus assembly protein CpaE
VAVTPTRNLPVRWTPPESQLILVAKSRGGVGATSVAVNLALELQTRRRLFGPARSRRVALVDFDVQFGNAGTFLDLDDRGGMLALLRLREEPDAQAVRHAMLTHPSGLRVLVAPRTAIPLEALDAERVEAILAALMTEFDFVVADLPPALVGWLEPLIVRARRLLLVSDLSVPSVACTRRVLDLMREDNPDLATDIVISRERKPLLPRKLHREAALAIGLPLAHWLPDEPKLARQALDRGEPLSLLAPRSAWAKSVRQIAASIEAARLTETKA